MALVRKDSGEKKQKSELEVAWSQEWVREPALPVGSLTREARRLDENQK